jgi:methionyl-tRNA formyltransferase
MRIVVHGQQAFGKAVLEALLKRGENVIAVYAAPEKPGAESRSAEGSRARREPPGLSAGFLQEAGSLGGVQSAQARPAGHGLRHALCARGIPQHPDPRLDPVSPVAPAAYRGASAINWPIIKGEKETGLSIFWPDNGLDTGDVLVQKKTPISDTDTLGSVYFDRLFPLGVEAMLESVDLVKAGKAPRIKQDHSKGHL